MAEKSIELDSVEIAAAIFGNCDRNIRLLERSSLSQQSAGYDASPLWRRRPNVAAAVRAVEGCCS